MANANLKHKIELTYMDGVWKSYAIQMNGGEYTFFNGRLLRYSGRPEIVALALQDLSNSELCTKSHKSRIKEILSNTNKINFKIIDV
jgi:hypothetical protein